MKPSNSAPIGVFDSGVGGLTVLNALKSALPNESFVYLGDTARVPYGSKPLSMVEGFAQQIVSELLNRGVKAIVIACNTASAAALPQLADSTPVPVWGVIEPGVRAALVAANGGSIGVIGTVGTIGARVYQNPLEAAGATTWSRACPLFVPIVEEGLADPGASQTIAELVATHYLHDRPQLNAVILGCTHYPALKPVLARVLGSEVRLVDSAAEVAATVKAALTALGLSNPSATTGSVNYLVTGDAAAFAHTGGILGMPQGTIQHLDVAQLGKLRSQQ